jgi:phosphoserine phosphatase
MRKRGAFCAVVSGGFDFFTSRVAAHLGADAHFANRLEIEEGRLTGKVLPPLVDQQAKRALLLRLCEERQIAPAETLAVGDGANDIPMILEAGFGVAYHAKPRVQESAPHLINYADLRALLYAQGYEERDFSL